MTKKAQQIAELKALIAEELGDCNEELWPRLCSLRQTEIGYLGIEEKVIRYVVKEAMPIGSALAFIEQELQHADGD